MVSISEKYSYFAVMCKVGSQKCLDKTGSSAGRWFMYWTRGVRYGLEPRTPRDSRIWNFVLKRKAWILQDIAFESISITMKSCMESQITGNFYRILYAVLFRDRPLNRTCVYLRFAMCYLRNSVMDLHCTCCLSKGDCSKYRLMGTCTFHLVVLIWYRLKLRFSSSSYTIYMVVWFKLTCCCFSVQ